MAQSPRIILKATLLQILFALHSDTNRSAQTAEINTLIGARHDIRGPTFWKHT